MFVEILKNYIVYAYVYDILCVKCLTKTHSFFIYITLILSFYDPQISLKFENTVEIS